jgi:uncharacterized repeat protein (TIGR03806 family)
VLERDAAQHYGYGPNDRSVQVAFHRAASPSLIVASLLVLQACRGSSSDGGSPPLPPPPPPPPPGATVGLDARPNNATCVAPAKNTGGGTTIALERVFPNLTFNQPVAMLQAPGDDSRWFVLEKGSGSAGTARVRAFANSPTVATAPTFLSLTVNANSEGGLLGLAFHPQWATNRHAFVSYTAGSPMASFVARYTSTDGGLTLNPATREEIIRVNQPFENHNGGGIAFGPDGFLYFGLGDGGSGGDPNGSAQDTTDLLGSMLRLNVNGALPYTIPSDNPFAGGRFCGPDHGISANDCPEIYAWGLRNPWRWSFDSATGDLWVGDVGQGAREEIDRVRRGGNYGWNCREGFIAYSGAPGTCPAGGAGFDDPVHDYGRALGASVTGGYVYRGRALPALAGRYVFGDFVSGRIWRLVPSGAGLAAEELLDTNLQIASFGQGNDGELYVVDYGGGRLYKLVDGGGAPPSAPPVPAQLSSTGCVSPQSPSRPASGLIPYEPAAPFWSDNAAKERWLAIPNGTSITVGADGDFGFPNGTVLMKHFRLNGALVETRLLMRHPDGEWAGYTYEWNAQGTDATLVEGGKTVDVGSQDWIFPSGNDCLACHTPAAGFALGLEAAQLNRDLAYAATGRTANQLRTLDAIALFATPLGSSALQPAMPDPFDASAALAERARAYLHTNCAQCHRPGGPTPSSIDLRYSTLLSGTNACGALPQEGDLGLGAGARIIAPGNAASSVLAARMARRDADAMPPLASSIVDAAGVALINEWIESLTTCQ